MMNPHSLIFVIANLLLFSQFSDATDTLTSSQSIADSTGGTLVSQDGSFELGFFSPGSSRNRYLGIWYKNISIRTVVWVANRSSPINDTSGLLMINNMGNLIIVSSKNMGSVVWSSNSSKAAALQSPVVQLQDSGNLVLREGKDDENSGIYLWQSFDHPTDTLLPGMKIGVNLKTRFEWQITSWKNRDDPSPGDLVWKIIPHNYPESTIWNGSNIFSRTGPWNGISFSGSLMLRLNKIFDFYFVNTEEEVYYIYYLKKKSVISRVVMNPSSNRRERQIWDESSMKWILYSYIPTDYCDQYDNCGPYGICVVDGVVDASPICQCLKGFDPKSPEQWNSGVTSHGCKRNKSLDCSQGTGDGFLKFTGLKLPDTTHSWVNKSMNIQDCRAKCLHSCSCTAYTSFNISGEGSGCALWFDDLIDIREIPSGGQDLYIRLSASKLAELEAVKHEPDKKIVVKIIPAIAVASGILGVSYYFCKGVTKSIDQKEKQDEIDQSECSDNDMELPLFDFVIISHATDKFSLSNKLGEGGFGPVYKGTLMDGREIAVKRLSKNSWQGLKEFKNEVKLIAKLQHRNLVKLLGCCIEGEERMLIYEYMPNKSLNSFIFDPTRGKVLDWPKRFKIVCGIARGLLYLHQDSRLRIIHRDLKASNVLLDKDMNPKISDFGMAKTFGADQNEGNTNRVVGTYGYMAPEYATDGLFSVKSDVFSFGILMLEIINGKRSHGFYHPNYSLNLVGYAWKLWKDGKFLELIDPLLREACHLSEVKRCVHISLLCVQHHPKDRPTMASVVLMLGSEIAFPQPKEPGFFKDKGPLEAQTSSSNIESFSANEISLSLLDAR
ncbi:hypothetical protein P3X46_006732 [Hevea brasiliensis]|uniref:Receptor-like serine/threonine-protein kinase n=3 Tax=Hevea brasiliensis TaxID=3981 RepID=A0ABQ9MR57_HEVBR|nr:hypothetical protein P3X46_006732 [Hevea brasiliensis]